VVVGLSELRRLWRMSGEVYGETAPSRLRKRFRYVARAREVEPLLLSIIDAPAGSLLWRHVTERRSIVLGLVDAPYINARWGRKERLEAFVRQCALVGAMGALFDFALNESIELPPIPDLAPDYSIIMDKPAWSQREGLLAISVFHANVRLFSISFSFDDVDGKKTLMIGGVQGRRIEGALEEYRRLTDLAHGLHPRKLLIEILRMVGAEVGVQRIVAISDACRHHRHDFFGKNKLRDLPLDYDEIWRDRGGFEMEDRSFFEIPLNRLVRDLDDLSELSPKKRKKRRHQYRLRYPMLDAMESDIRAAMPNLRPVVRPEPE
jgi:uncharacterized protein VirK/YbjX